MRSPQIEKSGGATDVKVRLIGPQCNRAREVLLRCMRTAQVEHGIAAIVDCLDMIGVEREHAIVICQCVLEPSEVLERVGAVVERIEMVWNGG